MRSAELSGGGWGGGRRRMRRGDVRTAILLALGDGPANGYEVMGRLEERSGGIWRPSPGSVYPTLQMLEDEGLVHSTTTEGSRTFERTEAGGAAAAAAHAARAGRDPWDQDDGADERLRTLRRSMGQAFLAAKQVASAGSAAQVDRSIEIVQRARRELYQILAED
ncbi:MAG TPA: PadR family transcriptional regulator [Acidimicrobiales bacterium]|jgi:DNA-binding PadR family transcriptional regulator|nr:PadR family transcriptional regulator [Acidimicrobiales bacterium]